MWRKAATDWLERRWYGQVPPNAALRALAGAFGRVAESRRRRARPERAGVPVIVVGNIAVGGTGKTPLVIALVEARRARGWRPGVISRGHGRRTRDARRVSAGATPAEVGDEPLLIAHRTAAPVAVAFRRIEAARLLVESGEVDLLIADDGLQHHGLARDLEILVIDGRRRYGNGRLLPAGPLREPAARAARCDFIVCNGGRPEAGEVLMQLELQQAETLDGAARRSLESFAGQGVHAVAGIGNPKRFFGSLVAKGMQVLPHAFPDHHAFRPADLDFGDDAPVLMTEKDAVKCRDFARPHWYAVPVAALLPESFIEALAARLAALEEAPA